MALTPAERQRRKRERDRAGRRRVVLTLDEAVIDDLLRLAGLLDCDDQREAAAAVALAVERLARRQLEAAVTRRDNDGSETVLGRPGDEWGNGA